MNCMAFTALVAVFVLALMPATALAGTQVYVRPSFMDAAAFTPVSGTISIETDRPGLYRIAISGVPSDWISYPETVRVESRKEKAVTYVISPKAAGSYSLFVTVNGPGGSFDFENELWVGYAGSGYPAGSAGAHGDSGAPGGGTGDAGLTGMFTLSAQNAAIALYTALALAVIITVFLGYMTLRKEGAPAGPHPGTERRLY